MRGTTQLLCILGIFVVIVASAFAVIASTHKSRELYATLQDREARRWYLEEEYSRLLIEQSTWASHYRIAAEAQDTLGLRAPSLASTRRVSK